MSLLENIICFALIVCAAVAASSGSCGDNVNWSYDADSSTLTINGSGVMTDFENDTVVPWKDVRAFIKHVVVQEGVSSIGAFSFSYCVSLKSIDLPSTVTSIGDRAFNRCFDLESIEIRNKTTTIGTFAFCYCKSLKSLVIPPSVTSIGQYAFQSCSFLTSITLPNISYTSIQAGTFRKCTSLPNITLPHCITSIAEHAFEQCISLTSIEIPSNVTSIGSSAFVGCKSLANVTLPQMLKTIQAQTFRDCSSLDNVSIPSSVEEIETLAFGDCSSLSNLTIPNDSNLTRIKNGIFQGCNLTTITIPSKVTSLGTGTFSFCHNLISIEVSANNTAYMSVDGVLFQRNETRMNLTEYPRGRGGDYAVPDNVTVIISYSFQGSQKLTSVTIPPNVSSVGVCPFASCTRLKSINVSSASKHFKSIDDVLFNKKGSNLIQYPCGRNESYIIPDNVTTIRTSSFRGCSVLKNVTISSTITSIEERAFSDCSNLTSITIPSGVTSIKPCVFSGCINLKAINVDVNNKNFKDIDGVLFNHNGTKLIQYPCGHSSNYTIPDNVTTIGDQSFSYCSGLTSVTIPATVTLIDQYAFNTVSMSYVNYLGTNEPSCPGDTPKSASTFVTVDVVCVPSNYTSSKFCGKYKVKVDSCEEFVAQQNQCYEVLEWQSNEITVKKRAEAALWEAGTNNCFEQQCLNTSGNIAWSKCNSTGDVHRVCIDNQCIEEKYVNKDKIAVEMEVNITPTEYGAANLSSMLSNATGLKEDEISFASEATNTTGNVVRIIVYVDDEKSARNIIEAVESCNRNIPQFKNQN